MFFSVGFDDTFFMFAPWKRLEKMAGMQGARIVVGYNYRNPESSDLISLLFGAGVAIWTNTSAATLASLFRSSRCSAASMLDCVWHIIVMLFKATLRTCDAVWGRREVNMGGEGSRGNTYYDTFTMNHPLFIAICRFRQGKS
jgi:hypothetical protein